MSATSPGLLSDRVVASLVAYAAGRDGVDAVRARLDPLGLALWLGPPTGRWVASGDLLEVAAALAGPEGSLTGFAAEAGFHAMRLEPMGGLAHIIEFLAGPDGAFDQVRGLLPLFVRDATVTVERSSATVARVQVSLPTPSEPGVLLAFGAGLLSALPTFWGRPRGRTEIEAGAAGDGRMSVTYEVHWTGPEAAEPGDRAHGPQDHDQLERAATALREGVEGSWFQVGPQGRVLGVGGSAGTPLGLVPGAVGRALSSLAEPWAQAPLAGLVEAARSGHADHATVAVGDAEGPAEWVRVRLLPTPDGGFVGTIADWTDAHRRRRSLMRTGHLNAIGRLAEAAATSLGNALTGILGYADLGRQTAEPALAQRALRIIAETAHDARQAVDLLGGFVGGADGERSPEQRTDVARVLRQVLDLGAVDRRWSSIEVSTPLASLPTLRGAEAPYKHLVFGLLQGALPAVVQGTVRLEGEIGGHELVLRVTARPGTGQSAAEAWSDPEDPTLAGCHATADDLGGRLQVRRASDGSVTAELSCPLAVGVAADASSGAPSARRPLEVLVVDDEAIIRTLLIDIVTHEGHAVSGAAHGGEAWKLLLERHFDVVLCDILMPVMSGLELFTRMETMEPRPIAIAMTGKTTRDMEQAIRQHAVAAILQKPFPMHEVTALLERIAADLEAPDTGARPGGAG